MFCYHTIIPLFFQAPRWISSQSHQNTLCWKYISRGKIVLWLRMTWRLNLIFIGSKWTHTWEVQRVWRNSWNRHQEAGLCSCPICWYSFCHKSHSSSRWRAYWWPASETNFRDECRHEMRLGGRSCIRCVRENASVRIWPIWKNSGLDH